MAGTLVRCGRDVPVFTPLIAAALVRFDMTAIFFRRAARRVRMLVTTIENFSQVKFWSEEGRFTYVLSPSASPRPLTQLWDYHLEPHCPF